MRPIPRHRIRQLRVALKKEKDPKVKQRLNAINAYIGKVPIANIAITAGVTEHTVRNWINAYIDNGFVGLVDKKKPGRPMSVDAEKIGKIFDRMAKKGAVVEEIRDAIEKETGRRYSLSWVRRLIARHGMTGKVATLVYGNRATRRFVLKWRWRRQGRIAVLRERHGGSLRVFTMDEAIFTYDMESRRKFWTWGDHRVVRTKTGSHRRRVAYYAYSEDKEAYHALRDKFNAETVVAFLDDLRKKYSGPMLVILDRASQHRAKMVTRMARRHPDFYLMFLPVGSPYLNPVEECWHQAKNVILGTRNYDSFDEMCGVMADYFEKTRLDLDFDAYLNRDPADFGIFGSSKILKKDEPPRSKMCIAVLRTRTRRRTRRALAPAPH